MLEVNKQTLFETTAMRADIYRLFSSLYFKELTDQQIQTLSTMDFSGLQDLDPQMAAGAHDVARYFRRMRSEMREELAVDYAHIFYAAGSSKHEKRAVPYESVFTSAEGLLMQEARDQVLRYMLDEHVEPTPELHIPEDHISFILDFMATLCERLNQALQAGDDAEAERLLTLQMRFHTEHLANWIESLCSAIQDCCRTKFYGGVAQMTCGFVLLDASLMSDCLPLFAQAA